MKISRRELFSLALYFPPIESFAKNISPGKEKLPRTGDIIFSTRFERANSIESLKSFKADRCEWVYTESKDFVNELRQYVYHVGLATRSNPDVIDLNSAALGIDNQLIVAPWQRRMDYKWGSTQRSACRIAVVNWVKRCLLLGAQSIQLDDPGMEFSAISFAGGDFSPEAISNFSYYAKALISDNLGELKKFNWDIRAWVKAKKASVNTSWEDFNYENKNDPVWQTWKLFLSESVSNFIRSVANVTHTFGDGIPLSLNVSDPLPSSSSFFLLKQADYFLAEATDISHEALSLYCETAAAMNKPIVLTPSPGNLIVNQKTIAIITSHGGIALVPWDVFIPDEKGSRYYGQSKDYAQYYQFSKDQKKHFRPTVKSDFSVTILCDPKSSTKRNLLNAAALLLKLGIPFSINIIGEIIHAESKNILPVDVSLEKAKIIYPRATIHSSELDLERATSNRLLWSIVAVTPCPYTVFMRIRENATVVYIVEDAVGSQTKSELVTLQISANKEFTSGHLASAKNISLDIAVRKDKSTPGFQYLEIPIGLGWAIILLE